MIMMYYLFILPRGGGNLKRTWRAYMLSQTEHVETVFLEVVYGNLLTFTTIKLLYNGK